MVKTWEVDLKGTAFRLYYPASRYLVGLMADGDTPIKVHLEPSGGYSQHTKYLFVIDDLSGLEEALYHLQKKR